jgi:hypothetical protein
MKKEDRRYANMGRSLSFKPAHTGIALTLLLCAALVSPARAGDAISPGEFVVERPTLICLGFQWFVEGDDNRNATANVEYRVKGAETWKQALALLRIKGEKVGFGKGHGGLTRDAFYTCPNMFAGSIFDLQPGTEYECRLTLADPDGVQGEAIKTLTLRTRAEPTPPTGGRVRHVFPGGKTPAGFDLKEGERVCDSLVEALLGTHGGVEGYAGWATRTVWDQVKPGDVILIHKGIYTAKRFIHWGTYLNFHGTYFVRVKGTPEKPILIKAAGDGPVVIDAAGAYRAFDVEGSHHLWLEGLTIRNADIGVGAGDVAPTIGLTVTKCRFENVGYGVFGRAGRSRDFYIADNTFVGRQPEKIEKDAKGAYNINPEFSPAAVHVAGQGHVVCHNYLTRFFDGLQTINIGACEVTVDGGGGGGGEIPIEEQTSACDFYNNELRYVWDNFIEADMSHHNVRMMRNLCVDAVCPAWSNQTVWGGPVYWIRNVSYHCGGSWKEDLGPKGCLSMHNTFIKPAGGFWYSLDRGSFNDLVIDEKDVARFFQGGLPSYSTERFEATPGEVDVRLKKGGPAIDAAKETLPNINDDFAGKAPDLGAIEFGKPLPHYGPRPIAAGSGNRQ